MYGKVAVDGFFFLSGLLICQSWFACSSFLDYMWRRTLRIFPGYWVCLLVTAAVIAPAGAFLQGMTTSQYLATSPTPLVYLIRNFAMVGGIGAIGTTYELSPFGNVVNGSLWTLSIEYLCYIVLAFIGGAAILRRFRAVTILIVGLLFFWHLFPQFRLPTINGIHLPTKLTSVDALELYLFFGLGTISYLFRGNVSIPYWLGGLALAITLSLFAYESQSELYQFSSRLIRPLAIPVGLLYLARTLPWKQFDHRRDLSYGVYIYSFPIQQTLAVSGFRVNGFPFFFLSYCITAVFAYLSWTLVESPALKFKKLFQRKKEPVADREKQW